ncbi:DUF4230 domain-containing protein [Bacillus tuaregi]|uniref:DUF4230 domain-containing protein n=1 Tax=Bacillus tuaregi TaxID=1816695 RepID=UPI000AE0C83A|nr:DUF4230 domain-containing protein [Bacillus tuaregi]
MDTHRELIEEKNERIAELERQLIELKDAREQSAAAIAIEHNTRSFSPRKGLFFKARGWKILLAILVLLVIASGGFWLFGGNTFKQKSVSFVEQVQELATLATAEAHIKAVIKEEDNKIFGKDISKNLPGTKRELLFIVPGTVIAGVDLKGITSEDMVINEETKEIEITLPHAKLIQDPALQMDNIQTFENGGLFRADTKMDEGFQKVAEAQEQMRQEALSIGLLETAEKNAEKVLKEFFKNIDYTVEVTYRDGGTGPSHR